MNVIHNAKDNSLKLILDEPELFVDFLKDYVKIDLLNDVTPDDIEDMTERFIPLFQDSKDSDTVKRIKLKGDVPLFVIAIVEHESEVNYRASFKMLQYITLVLTEYEKEANKDNPNASAAKDFKFPPVLPVIFHDGIGEWTAVRNFIDKVELNSVFEKYIPKFEYELVELKQYDESDLIKFGNALSLIMIIDKIRKPDRMSILSKLPTDYIEKLKQNIPPGLYKLLADVITLLLKRINVSDEEIGVVTEQLYERRLQEMFAMIEQYDVQETRRSAKAEGHAEGREDERIIIAKRLLKMDIPMENIVLATGLTRKEVEALRNANKN